MEAQPTPPAPPPPPDSVDSSPRASWDEPFPPPSSSAKLRLMCSYGGHIVPRPHDKSLCYVGGDTRIVVVPRHTSLLDLSTRLSKSFLHGHARPFVLKYQLPSEDLDSLVSVTSDEDLENMIDEYENNNNNSNNNKPSRIRLFLFPSAHGSDGSMGLGSAKSEEWLSGSLDGGTLSESASVNCLLGLDEEAVAAAAAANGNGNGKVLSKVSDSSAMLESVSSFGSGSSVPNLPPIKVHVVEDQKGVVGIEEQFVQLGVGQKQQQEEGFVVAAVTTTTEFAAANRLVSDDERSDHGVPLGYRKSPTPPPQPQSSQFQQKSPGVVDLPSPDSLSSDSSLSNAMLRPKPAAIYQDQVQIQSGNSQVPSNTLVDPKLNVTDQQGWIQMPQQHQTQQPQHQHQTQQPQHQQYIHNTHLVHHAPSGPVQIPASYYPVYQQQLHPQQHHHHLDQQYPVYYVQARQAQAYNMSVQPTNVAESATTIPSNQSQNQPNSTAYNQSRNPNSEMAAGTYRTAPATPQLVQVPSSKHQQQQYVAYSQIHHHHPQSVPPPNSAVPASYAYNYADPAHTQAQAQAQAQVFYTQPLAPSMPSQYQTMTTAAAAMRPEVSAQLPLDGMKQQVRTSQPL